MFFSSIVPTHISSRSRELDNADIRVNYVAAKVRNHALLYFFKQIESLAILQGTSVSPNSSPSFARRKDRGNQHMQRQRPVSSIFDSVSASEAKKCGILVYIRINQSSYLSFLSKFDCDKECMHE